MSDAMETSVPVSFPRRGVRAAGRDCRPGARRHAAGRSGGAPSTGSILLDTGKVASGSEIARLERLHASTVNELLRLTLLGPDVVEQWMAGRQPRRLTLMWFQRHRLPADWHEHSAASSPGLSRGTGRDGTGWQRRTRGSALAQQ